MFKKVIFVLLFFLFIVGGGFSQIMRPLGTLRTTTFTSTQGNPQTIGDTIRVKLDVRKMYFGGYSNTDTNFVFYYYADTTTAAQGYIPGIEVRIHHRQSSSAWGDTTYRNDGNTYSLTDSLTFGASKIISRVIRPCRFLELEFIKPQASTSPASNDTNNYVKDGEPSIVSTINYFIEYKRIIDPGDIY